MGVILLLALAVAPGFAIAFFVYEKDKLDREPMKLLVISFLLGALSIIPALILEEIGAYFGYNDKGNPQTIAIYSLIVGFSEEVSKFAFLMLFAYPKKEFNEPFDGITYGVMVSLGFATLENILYVVPGGMGLGFLRMFTAVPAHACFGVLMGYFIGLAKFKKDGNLGLKLLGLGSAALFHAFYDFFLFMNNQSFLFLGAFIALIVAIRLSLKAIRIHRQNSPFSAAAIENDKIDSLPHEETQI